MTTDTKAPTTTPQTTGREAAGIDTGSLHWGLTDATVRVEVVESAKPPPRGYAALVGFDASGRAIDLVGEDGGEPEDQILWRDWAWVPTVVNALFGRIARLTRERDEANARAETAEAERDKARRGMDPRIGRLMAGAISAVATERHRQNEKWGPQWHTWPEWLAVLTEEVGEVAHEVKLVRWHGASVAGLRDELTHVAAVAVAIIEQIDDAGEEDAP